MTTPSIFSDVYADANALHRAPVKRDGSLQHVRATSTIPVSTATSTNVGLIPFNKGAKVCMKASTVKVGDADTGSTATCTLGWIYDDAVTYTSDPDGFATTSTAPQSGGIIAFDAVAGYAFVAEAPGWIVLVTGGETVEVEYTAVADIAISYN